MTREEHHKEYLRHMEEAKIGRQKLDKAIEEYKNRVPEPEKKATGATNWSEIFSGMLGGVTVGMIGIMTIVGVVTGITKTVTKDHK